MDVFHPFKQVMFRAHAASIQPARSRLAMP